MDPVRRCVTAGAWLLRWDTVGRVRPEMIQPAAGQGRPAQTFEAESGRVAVFDGYLFDRASVGGEAERSDACVVESAYERWGNDLFDKLRGGFTLAVWDAEQRCLLAGRDAMGLVPSFYWWDGRLFLLSSSIDAILLQPEVDGSFNRVVIAEYLENKMSFRQVHETFYRDIRRLPPAHTLSVGERRLRVSRYWDPVPPGFAWATDDELSRFPAVLGEAVDRCLSVGADSLGLSGGFDSVSLAVVAAERRRARPLHAVSLRFTEPSCDEGETQTQVARALGMPQLIRSFDDCLDDDAFSSGLADLSRVSPNPVLSPWQPMYHRLLQAAADQGLSHLMVGTGGDEMFYVATAYGADCLAAFDLQGLWRFYRVCQRTSSASALRVARTVLWDGAINVELKQCARGVLGRISPRALDWIIRRRRGRGRPPWLVPGDRELTETLDGRRLEAPSVELAPGERAYVRSMRQLPQAPILSLELDQGFARAAHAGFRLLFPYLDRDLVELALRMRPEHLMAGGRAKGPLRRLVADRLVAVSMRTRKVSFARMFDDLFRASGRRAWREIGGPATLAELGLVDGRGVNATMERYWAGADRHGFHAWLVLSTELWLRSRARSEVREHRRVGHEAA
jgi:asparagine synthase (glutamine-hydrolysing)